MARVRSEEYDDKRLAILKEASRLFAEQGFARTSIAQIATACNASKAWIYHYYDSKEQILFDLLDSHIRHLLSTIEAAEDPSLPPEQRVQALIHALLWAYRDADHTHKVQLNDLGILPEEQQEHIKEMERRLVAMVAEALAAVNPALKREKTLLKPVTMALFGMLNWAHQWFRPDGPMSLDDYAALCSRLIIDGCRNLP